MSIIDLQESLKDVSDDGLVKAFRSGSAPQFLVLGELQRRKRMRDEYKRQEAADMPTVAEEMIAGAGVPQGGLMAMAGAMAPKTNVAQDTGLAQAMPMQATRAPQPMADGGIVKMDTGGILENSRILETISPAVIEFSLNGTYGLNTQRDMAGLAISGQFGSEMQADVISQALSGAYGDDIKRLAEQSNSLLNPEETSLNSVSTEIEDFTPTVMGEGPRLKADLIPDRLNSDTTFVAPETVSDPRERGALAFNRYSTGGLGSMSLDSSVPQMALDTPLSLNQIIDSGVGIRSADTNRAKQLTDSLAMRRFDLPGVNLPGESDPYIINPDAAEKQGQAILDSLMMDDLMRQAKIEREGYGAVMQNPTQEIPYNPATSVIDYNPRNTGEAQFQLETEQAYNKKLYTDRLAIERRIDRLKKVAETPDDFKQLAALEAHLNSMGGSTAENPGTAQLRQAELNFGKFIMDEREAAILAPVAREVKVITDTVTQLRQSLKTADEESKPIIEQRLQEELVKLSQAQNNLNAVESTLDQDPTESDISTVPTMTEILGGKAPLEAVIVPDKVSGGTKTVVKDDVFRTPIGNFNDAELATVGGEQTIVPSGISGDDPYDEISPAKLSNVLGQTTGTPLSLEGGVESLLPPSLTGDGTGDGTGGGTGGGTGDGTGGDPYSALESRIAKMLDDREKSAESDKFLALAQAGLALMASDSPTLGGAIGEAGLVGISQLRDARNQYDKDILGLLSTQADIDAARSDSALAKRRLDLEEAALDTTGMKPGDLLDYLANLNTQQTNLTKQLSENLVENPDERNDVRNRIIVNELEIERVKRLLGYGSSTKDLAD